MKRVYKLFLFAALIGAATFLKAVLPLVLSATWAPAAPMSSSRTGGSAVLLQDGRVLIAGGDTGSGPTATAEFFNTDGSVSPAVPMNVARSKHISVVLQDGRVLVAGGTVDGGGATNPAEIFGPIANSLTSFAWGTIEGPPRRNSSGNPARAFKVCAAGDLAALGKGHALMP